MAKYIAKENFEHDGIACKKGQEYEGKCVDVLIKKGLLIKKPAKE